MAPSLISNEEDPARAAKRRQADAAIERIVDDVNFNWNLKLELPKPHQSPSSRQTNMTIEDKCVFMIKAISYRNTQKIVDIGVKFGTEARQSYIKWVHKPKAERGVVPESTRQRPHPLTDSERRILLESLHRLLAEVWEPMKSLKPVTPKRFLGPDANINDAPVPFALGKGSLERSAGEVLYHSLGMPPTESKRARDEAHTDTSPVKKAKPDVLQSRSLNEIPLPDPFTGRGRSFIREARPARSADTSFTSEKSSFWSTGPPASFSSTQETVPDDEPTLPGRSKPSFMEPQPAKQQSSEHASSSFEARVADLPEEDFIISNADEPVAEELSQDLNVFGLEDELPLAIGEQQLRDCLDIVFPKLPQCLKRASLPIAYEITRVFLNAGVSLSQLSAPITDRLLDYDTLWRFLNSLPVLQGHSFPEKCSDEVWRSSLNGFERGNFCVILTGKLTFNTDFSTFETASDPLFKVHLEPLKLDQSHRTDRRWGSDRSLELTVPEFTGSNVPTVMKRHEKKIGPGRWRELLNDWLVTSPHLLFGRVWKPFACRSMERDRKKKKGAGTVHLDTYRVNFFALDGPGFQEFRNPLTASKADRPIMNIDQLLDSIRPTVENEKQSYLKLFSRTALALSRNDATLILEESQIRRRQRDIREGYIEDGVIDYGAPRDLDEESKGPVMNDGAGRISRTLAAKVKDKLALTYTPSAFQGRFGGAKGLWVVDHTDNSNVDWIEIYPSQQKWNLRAREFFDDPSHRTLEVNNISGPLKSADLNAQLLPLLVDRARDERAMKDAITTLLKLGLRQRLDDIQAAVDEPETFKKWIRESNANVKEKLKFGDIPCLAGLPVSPEEKLNLLLDAGFHPKQSLFMKEEALKLFTFRTDDLKERMNITVGKSCYAYMVPDFWGVLGPDEVYMDFSSFKDETSGFSSVVLRDDYVLVARSPAHFASDIQRVRAVVKQEFLGLKDIIIFPIKGNPRGKPSLADKLSGGDYDGDIAWVCWEEDIVNNFVSVPPLSQEELPNLVQEGFLTKDKRTYTELVDRQQDSTSTFLKAAFDFNMRPSKLGICTNFKESVFYTLKKASDPRNVALCKLLSDLVDQAKNGYGFTEESWQRFKNEKVIIKPREPAYKSGVVYNCRGSNHILDHLTFVSHKLVDEAVHEFHMNFEQPPSWDDDLVVEYNWACELAKTNHDWSEILEGLKADLTSLKAAWSKFPWPKKDSKKDDDETQISAFKMNLYEQFKDIRPRADSFLGKVLLGPNPGHDLSQWHLLKASTLFAMYKGKHVSNIVWWMSAKQLCHMKAIKYGTPHSVIPRMYILLKPDNNMIRRMETGGYNGRNLEEMASIVNVEDLEDLDD